MSLSPENPLYLGEQFIRELQKIPDSILFVDRPYFKTEVWNTQEGRALADFNSSLECNSDQSQICTYGRTLFTYHLLKEGTNHRHSKLHLSFSVLLWFCFFILFSQQSLSFLNLLWIPTKIGMPNKYFYDGDRKCFQIAHDGIASANSNYHSSHR